MKKQFITSFTRTPESIRKTNVVKFTQPSKVVQSLNYACKIDTIYDNYCKQGILPLNGNKPIYDENFIKYDSLVEAQNLVKEATSYFASLPADIRKQYGNSLEKFVNAVHTQDDFLVKSGVLKVTKHDSTIEEPTVQPTVQPIVQENVHENVNTAPTDVL